MRKSTERGWRDTQAKGQIWALFSLSAASWEPILKEDIYFEAQKLLEEARTNERARLSKGEKRVFLLTGILNCGETGLPLVGQAGHGSGGIIRYYHYTRRPKNIKNLRSRLHADELEEKLINEFKTALTTAGYFENLEKILKDQTDAKNKGSESEFNRAQKSLSEVTEKIGIIWANQGRMKLSEEALRLASDELNRLAKQKEDLEKYIASLSRDGGGSTSIKTQSLFVENQIKALLQGWAKATPAMRKRLIRRTVKSIVVTREEMQITFWLSAEERDESLYAGSECDLDEAKKILAFRRNSPKSQDQNESVKYSGNIRIGRQNHTLPEKTQAHKKIELSGVEAQRISDQIIKFYGQGHSLNEVANLTATPRTTVRSILLKAGIELRSSVPLPFNRAKRESGKGSIRPYYGFCYFQGRIVPDQREYNNLLLIHRLWKTGTNPNAIAGQLNAKKIPARCASTWNRNSVVKILKRFEDRLISLKGGQLEIA